MLALFKVLTEVFRGLKTPVVVAFDQLEDLLLARRTDDAHKTAEAFFAGIVQVMHQIDGLCFLIFAERGLWNRFVPSLDGYIQDRLNNPVHVPKHGTVKAIRLEAPAADLVRRVVEARLRPCLGELPPGGEDPRRDVDGAVSWQFCTSGTTGLPKGAMLTGANVLNTGLCLALEMPELREGGPSGPAVLAAALKALGSARASGDRTGLAAALGELASAAVRWRDRL